MRRSTPSLVELHPAARNHSPVQPDHGAWTSSARTSRKRTSPPSSRSGHTARGCMATVADRSTDTQTRTGSSGCRRTPVALTLGCAEEGAAARPSHSMVINDERLVRALRTCSTSTSGSAENVRANHVHVVVAATVPSRRIAAVLKANATRAMRSARCWTSDESPWSRGASAKRVWTELELEAVVRYVLEGRETTSTAIVFEPATRRPMASYWRSRSLPLGGSAISLLRRSTIPVCSTAAS